MPTRAEIEQAIVYRWETRNRLIADGHELAAMGVELQVDALLDQWREAT